ncbi:MAG: hypothetical protein HY815_01910 [Candidatus Riflebacteria bacterium]|nr:hypothetical protein [Candidatus Riflebacteria bacterium]
MSRNPITLYATARFLRLLMSDSSRLMSSGVSSARSFLGRGFDGSSASTSRSA